MSHLLSITEPVGMNVNQSQKTKSQFISLLKQSNLINDEQSLIPENNKKYATSKTNVHKVLKKVILLQSRQQTIIGELKR